MPRTTRAQVAGIIELDPEIITSDADLLPFIELANELVTECCTGTKGPAVEYTETRLELIERCLTAHLYTARDPRVESERAGSVGSKFQSKVDLGFDGSQYGQAAMRMDSNGGLASLNENAKKGKTKVGMHWLGIENG